MQSLNGDSERNNTRRMSPAATFCLKNNTDLILPAKRFTAEANIRHDYGVGHKPQDRWGGTSRFGSDERSNLKPSNPGACWP